jgi:ADP-ribose pyrophosphatase YjhB (NUDIX family)
VSETPRIRVSALLRRGDAMLLIRHQKGVRSYWLLPGGGVEAGETLTEALARELLEECSLTDVPLHGPIAMAESISPPGIVPLKHVVHVIYYGDLSERDLELVRSTDGDIRGHRLVRAPEIAGLAIHPPIHRFVERWLPGDPFVHLGRLWAR